MSASTGRAAATTRSGAGEPAGMRTALVGLISPGLAHEVRNPLNAMAIHLEVLADKLRGDDGRVPPELERNLAAARAQVSRVDEMVRRFSDFSAARAPPGADLEGLLRHALALCEHDVRRRGAATSLEVQPGVQVTPASEALLLLLLAALLHGWGTALPAGARLLVTLGSDGAPEVHARADGGQRLPEPAETSVELALTLGITLHEEDGYVLRLPAA